MRSSLIFRKGTIFWCNFSTINVVQVSATDGSFSYVAENKQNLVSSIVSFIQMHYKQKIITVVLATQMVIDYFGYCGYRRNMRLAKISLNAGDCILKEKY